MQWAMSSWRVLHIVSLTVFTTTHRTASAQIDSDQNYLPLYAGQRVKKQDIDHKPLWGIVSFKSIVIKYAVLIIYTLARRFTGWSHDTFQHIRASPSTWSIFPDINRLVQTSFTVASLLILPRRYPSMWRKINKHAWRKIRSATNSLRSNLPSCLH